ncbi:MAG: hypothetical protein ACFCVG_04340 [Kineosporiaceae bacterium]
MIPAPRSPAGDDALAGPADSSGRAEAGDPSSMSLADLRRQRTLLAGELHGVRYWRRIARAQTDLLVAGLVYHGRDLAGLHADGGPPARPAGERLVRLRERDRLMATYEHTLRHDLDRVTRELAGRVAGATVVTSPGHCP